MRLSLRLSSAFLLIVFTLALSSPVAAAPGVAPVAAPDEMALVRRAVELTNQERARAGLNPLKWNDQLAASATTYAQEMAARGFFAHNSPEGTTPVERARQSGYPAYGWGGLYVGENLARGYNSAESVHQGWMNSQSHRDNLLHPKYREIGIGIAVAPNGTRYWAQEFGSRPNVLPVFLNADNGTTETPEVTISLTAEEVSSWGSTSGILSMMISNQPDFAGATWEPFSNSRSWMIKGQPGVQPVYVRLQDANGRVVEAHDEIQYVGRLVMASDEPELLDGPDSDTALAGNIPADSPSGQEPAEETEPV